MGPSPSPARKAAGMARAGEPWMRRWGSTAAERQADLPGDPPHALGLAGRGVFTLRPDRPERTRLLVRGRIAGGLPAMTYRLTLVIPHFAMERRMLLGIKARAESAD
jgi:hypothetical protein